MKIFVCSPYGGDIENNTKRARAYIEMVIQQGHTPFAPHLLYPQILDEKVDRELGMELGLDMLTVMDEVWVFGERVTDGMRQEINSAISQGIPVRYVGELK